MIKIDHLSKKYNDNVVLDDISLEIKQGDVVGIIGPSGTGKSTLLRCVNRLETPEKGTVTIRGQGDRPFRAETERASVFKKEHRNGVPAVQSV